MPQLSRIKTEGRPCSCLLFTIATEELKTRVYRETTPSVQNNVSRAKFYQTFTSVYWESTSRGIDLLQLVMRSLPADRSGLNTISSCPAWQKLAEHRIKSNWYITSKGSRRDWSTRIMKQWNDALSDSHEHVRGYNKFSTYRRVW